MRQFAVAWGFRFDVDGGVVLVAGIPTLADDVSRLRANQAESAHDVRVRAALERGDLDQSGDLVSVTGNGDQDMLGLRETLASRPRTQRDGRGRGGGTFTSDPATGCQTCEMCAECPDRATV